MHDGDTATSIKLVLAVVPVMITLFVMFGLCTFYKVMEAEESCFPFDETSVQKRQGVLFIILEDLVGYARRLFQKSEQEEDLDESVYSPEKEDVTACKLLGFILTSFPTGHV